MIVMKFGGSSVKDAEMIKTVTSIVKDRLDKKPIIVLSAIKGVTDNLIKALAESMNSQYNAYEEIVAKHKEILSDLGLDAGAVDEELEELKKALEVNSKVRQNDAKILDYISFFGERMSTKVFAAHLNNVGIKANAFVSGDIGLITNSKFGKASMLDSSYEIMNQNLSNLDVLPVVTGFGGKDENGEYTTFDRGGSDYVAALIGAAVGAEEIQIWTDVNGIMSCDPRIVSNAKTIPELSFDEASELAFFGAKVLHPRTILPAIKKNIPVVVLNTFEPDHPGSRILNESKDIDGVIKAISYKKGITIIDVKSTRMLNTHGFLAKLFEIFERYKKSVDMVSTSEIHVSMSVDSKEDVDNISKELEGVAMVKVKEGRSIVYVVGASMKNQIGLAGKIFSILGDNGINIEMMSQCFEEVNVGFVVEESKAQDAVKLLHEKLID